MPFFAPVPHCDYSPTFLGNFDAIAGQTLGMQRPEGRCCVVNIWRPVRPPPGGVTTPLAVCDARSVGEGEWRPCTKESVNGTGLIEMLRLVHDRATAPAAAHAWFWCPDMQQVRTTPAPSLRPTCRPCAEWTTGAVVMRRRRCS